MEIGSNNIEKYNNNNDNNSNHLPARKYQSTILKTICSNQIILCIGETGSGKTTQIPQMLYEQDIGKIRSNKNKRMAITQPRRVATISVSNRVAHERKSKIGEIIGYSIRFDDKTTDKTKIKFMTDGILVRECLQDPLLEKYSIIMLDEAHERTIYTDILFGIIKAIIKKRKDLTLLVTSATLNTDKFMNFFNNCTLLTIPGRIFPVDIYHSKIHQIMGKTGPLSSYINTASDIVIKIHLDEPKGHILVFLTGQEEINKTCSQIEKKWHDSRKNDSINKNETMLDMVVLPLYGALHASIQSNVFKDYPETLRKVIVCTNIAETSLTVEGVRYVVDAGFVKQKTYNPKNGIESLVVVPISKVSAQQRAGRAGRTSSGKCYRLYSKESFDNMMNETIPEIRRTNLTNIILYLKALEIDDVIGFKYVDKPSKNSILCALNQLYVLGALNDEGKMTILGKNIYKFPLDPRLSRTIIESCNYGCEEDVIKIISMLSCDTVYHHLGLKNDNNKNDSKYKKIVNEIYEKYYHPLGDHFTLLNIFNQYLKEKEKNNEKRWCELNYFNIRTLKNAFSINQQLFSIFNNTNIYRNSKRKSNEENNMYIQQSFCTGYFMNTAKRCVNESVYKNLSVTNYYNIGNTNDNEFLNSYLLSYIHPTSCFNQIKTPEYCLYHELSCTTKAFMINIMKIKFEYIKDYIQTQTNLSRDHLYKLSNHFPSKHETNRTKKKENNTTKELVNNKNNKDNERFTCDTIKDNKRKSIENTILDAKLRFLKRRDNNISK